MLTEQDHRTAMRSCRYCPMCHHADLTATLLRRETYSARGRGLLLFAAEQDKLDQDTEFADVLYSFFADGLCRHVCAGHIPHDDMVIEARRQLVLAGRAPAMVRAVRDNIDKTGNPWGETEPDLVALTGARPQSDLLVYFGPAARIRRPGSVTALAGLFKAAEVAFSVLRCERDPGLLLYQLGEAEAGMEAARALACQIAQSGAKMIVTPDADAYRTLKMGLANVAPLSGLDVRHTSELLTDLVSRLKFHKPAYSRLAYHDPCALARFAPCLEAPRALIRAVCGAAPLEVGLWNRDFAHCSGECGGAPFTQPALSRKAAEHRIQAARDAGAELLVTGSPAAAAALEQRVLPVRELCEFVAERIAD